MKLKHLGRLRNKGGDALVGSIEVRGEVIKIRVYPNTKKIFETDPDFIVSQIEDYENQAINHYPTK